MKEIKGFLRFIVFCFVGGTSALIHFLVYVLFFNYIFRALIKSNMLIFGASLNHVSSYFMGVAISIIYNFSMNRNITFAAKNEPIGKQLPRYLFVYALSIGTGFIMSLIVINIIGESGINPLIATMSGILAGVPVSFLGSLLWTFKAKKNI